MFNNQPELQEDVRNALPLQPPIFPQFVFDDAQETFDGSEVTTSPLSAQCSQDVNGRLTRMKFKGYGERENKICVH